MRWIRIPAQSCTSSKGLPPRCGETLCGSRSPWRRSRRRWSSCPPSSKACCRRTSRLRSTWRTCSRCRRLPAGRPLRAGRCPATLPRTPRLGDEAKPCTAWPRSHAANGSLLHRRDGTAAHNKPLPSTTLMLRFMSSVRFGSSPTPTDLEVLATLFLPVVQLHKPAVLRPGHATPHRVCCLREGTLHVACGPLNAKQGLHRLIFVLPQRRGYVCTCRCRCRVALHEYTQAAHVA
mmetsp:Transcript_17490/g.44744  ORF Transcript_17490/g.44744 Transcript_17490/m.44744 type:complete len:234 (+) Transcript_17490:514-1215(+)